jgi:hypothetical protein
MTDLVGPDSGRDTKQLTLPQIEHGSSSSTLSLLCYSVPLNSTVALRSAVKKHNSCSKQRNSTFLYIASRYHKQHVFAGS